MPFAQIPHRSTLAGAVLLLAVAAAPAPPARDPFLRLPEAASLSPAERRQVVAGEVAFHFAPAGKGPREGIGVGVIDFPPERVFLALTDWGHWEEFMPYVERSDAAGPRPDGAVPVDQVLALPAPLGERRFRILGRSRVEGEGTGRVWRLDWAAVPGSGNLDAHRGSWALVELSPGRTLAVCRLLTDPGISTWMAERATGKSLPWIFDGLRQHARRSRYAPS